MSLHSQFAVNSAKEIEGVEVQYGPNADGTIPTFNVSRAAKANKSYSKLLEKLSRPYRRQMDLGTLNNDVAESIYKTVFIQTVLKGWQNVQVRKDDGTFETLAFTEVNARRLFDELPELYEDLQEKAKSAALFRDDAAEDEAGN